MVLDGSIARELIVGIVWIGDRRIVWSVGWIGYRRIVQSVGWTGDRWIVHAVGSFRLFVPALGCWESSLLDSMDSSFLL